MEVGGKKLRRQLFICMHFWYIVKTNIYITIFKYIFEIMKKIFLPVILGTARKDRQSEKVAHFLVNHIKETRDDIETELVDVNEYVKDPQTIAAWIDDDRAHPWREKAKEADGYIIVSPEYNHGYPGELKLLLDSAMKEYSKKPVSIAGVSAGGFGGTRLVENLWPVTLELGMIPVMNPLYFGKIKESFDADSGKPKDEKTIEFTDKFLTEMCWFAHTLKAGRNTAEENAYSCDDK